MENQNPTQSNPEIQNQAPPPVAESEPKGKFHLPKFAFLGIVFIILFVLLGGVYMLGKNNAGKQVSQTQKQTTAVSPTPNLNPNTGTLYGDIKVRLEEVIK